MKRRNLIVFRASQGLTQDAMADKIGVSRSTYSLVENGRQNCTPAFLERLQVTFNIPDEQMWSLTKIENKEVSKNG